MKINSIQLKNFRQYKDVSIDFATDEEKNITVIVGDNTFGKTTLVRAFLWGMYKTNNFKDQILLNKEVGYEMLPNTEETVSVKINLEHGNFTYIITTSEIYKKGSDGKVFSNSNVKTSISKMSADNTEVIRRPAEIANEIESILKQDLKDYFFYDGESNKIEEVGTRKNIKNAVSEMVGLRRIETFKHWFEPTSKNGVVNALQNDLEGDDFDLELVKSEFEDQCAELDRKKETIKNNDAEIYRLKKDLAEKELIIENNKDLHFMNLEKNALNEENKKILLDLDSDFDGIIKLVNGKRDNNMLKMLFSYCYEINQLESLDQKSSFNAKKSLTHISEEAIDQLIKRGYCLCGAVIEDRNDAYNHLVQAKEHMEPHDFGKYLKDFCDLQDSNVSVTSGIISNLNGELDGFLAKLETLDVNRERLREISKSIQGRPDVGEIQKSVELLQASINQLQGVNRHIKESDIPFLENKLEKIRKKLDKIASHDKENKIIRECLKYADYLYRTASKKLETSQNEIRDGLQTEVDRIFKSMYHGDRNIVISEDYKVQTTVNDDYVDHSTGSETVKNFAFVSGLLSLVKQHVLKGDSEFDDEPADENYPLVLDAPFSNTDPIHIKNICSNLPNYCDQLIVVVMGSHYDVAKEVLEPRVGKKYKIVQHSELFDTVERI